MNIKKDETLSKQLARIIETIKASGRKPMRVYLTWGQLETLRAENPEGYSITQMTFSGIPVQLTPPGSGMWVSCISDNEAGVI